MTEAMTEPACQLGTCNDYRGLQNLLRERAEALNISRNTLDEIGGFAAGHSSKLLAPGLLKNLGPVTLGLMLQSLGVRLVLVEDAAALERISPRLRPREVSVPMRALAWGKAGTLVVSKRWVRRIAREGGRARALALTPKQRSASARKAAKARWSKPRVTEIK
jgi:hypothetical protein